MSVRQLNFRTLDLNLLRVFNEVMVERNVTRAADRLAMSQPAVSNEITRQTSRSRMPGGVATGAPRGFLRASAAQRGESLESPLSARHAIPPDPVREPRVSRVRREGTFTP